MNTGSARKKNGTLAFELRKLTSLSSFFFQHCTCRRCHLCQSRRSRPDPKVWKSRSANSSCSNDLHTSQSQFSNFGQWYCHLKIAWGGWPQRGCVSGMSSGSWNQSTGRKKMYRHWIWLHGRKWVYIHTYVYTFALAYQCIVAKRFKIRSFNLYSYAGWRWYHY